MLKYVIGLMSGTSLDGLDIVYVRFDTENLKNYKILKADTINYSKEWENKLKKAFDYSAGQLAKLDAEYGFFLGKKINEFIQKNQIKNIDLIASHGQTVFHNPQQYYTTQIGSGAHINAITRIKTISDFRTQDVALGGQGAPLVPIGDRILFGTYKYCLNIGGFANISFEQDDKRIAYDICPANIVLNHYTRLLGKAYDDKGKIARSGKLITGLLKALNQMDFYTGEQPKSLGWEFVETEIIPLINSYSTNIPDILHTFARHVGMQIGRKTGTGKMIITGGGAYNDFLIEQIKKFTAAEVIIPDSVTINFKEALIFALLGLLRDQNQINVLSSVTGSKIDHSSGVIFDAFK